MISKQQILFSITALLIGAMLVGVAMQQHTPTRVALDALTRASLTLQEEQGDEKEEPTFPPMEDLVKDWEAPEFALFISGRLHGYIEPCGCVGLDRQKGGLLRRHTCQKLLLDRGWNLVSIDTGNQIRRYSEQALIKLRTAYQIICRTMNYDTVALGPDDVTKAPSDDLAQRIIDNRADDAQVICGNVVVLDAYVNQPYRVIQSGKRKIGVTALIGDQYLEKIKDDDVTAQTIAEAMPKLTADLKGEGCDLLVCTIHDTPAACETFARTFPVFDLVVCAGGPGDPKNLPDRVVVGDHVTQIILTGKKGMHVGIVGFYGDRQNVKYERVPLDARFTDSEDVKGHFKNYQDTLQQRYANNLLKDVTPRPHPSGNSFVGTDACRACHEREFDIWMNQEGGPHTHATTDLEFNPNDDRTWVQRNYDPECLSCHVTGWNPQEFYPYQTGFVNHDDDTHLTASGCENCHGPGSAHVRDQKLVDAKELDPKAKEVKASNRSVRLRKKTAKDSKCMECHDLDNSPDFLQEDGFATYWEKVKHGKSDK